MRAAVNDLFDEDRKPLGFPVQLGPEQANKGDIAKVVMKKNASPVLTRSLFTPFIPWETTLDQVRIALVAK